MILIDVNLLLYAYDASSTDHRKAIRWLDEVLLKPETVGLAWDTVLAFLRISADPRIHTKPFTLDEAISVVTSLFERSNVTIVHATSQHWRVLTSFLPKARVRSSLIMDAHLAALAIEHGATLCTNDRDFARFPGLRVEYPLQ